MKKILLAIIIFISTCIDINANRYTNYNIAQPNINQIVVNVPSKVHIYPADTFGINIRTKDLDLYKNIKYKIKKDILYIDFKDHYYLDDQLIGPDDVRINIQVPHDVKKISTNSNMLVAMVQKNNKATNHGKE